MLARRGWIAIALVYAGGILLRGPVSGVDSASYSRWADALIASGFNYPQFFANNTFMVPLPLYSAWLTVVAVAKLTARDSWPQVIMIANIAAIAVIARAVLSIERDWRGHLAAAVALLVAGDLLLFSAYVLSDVIFTALCTITLVALIRQRPRGGGGVCRGGVPHPANVSAPDCAGWCASERSVPPHLADGRVRSVHRRGARHFYPASGVDTGFARPLVRVHP
ncbi:MAG: hypothetical protein ACKOEC_16395 [Acidimicrobiia bacterium]